MRLAVVSRLRSIYVVGIALAAASCGEGSTAPTSGSLSITVAGLPSGPAAITVSGPAGYSHRIVSSIQLNDLKPGTYTVVAQAVDLGTATYAATSDSATVLVSASKTPARATVAYALASGSLYVAVSGLPAGLTANVRVRGPGLFARDLTSSQTLGDIPPGAYTITANVVTQGTITFGGTPYSQVINLPASLTPDSVSTGYSAMTGKLTVRIQGDLGGGAPSVSIAGPFTFSQLLTDTGTSVLTALPLGDYSFTVNQVTSAQNLYQASPAASTLNINSGTLNSADTVTYALASGALTVNMLSVGQGSPAEVYVRGPNNFVQVALATRTLKGLYPGVYTVDAGGFPANGYPELGAPTLQSVNVSASYTPAVATVVFDTMNLSISHMYITQATQRPDGSVPLVAGRDGELQVYVRESQTPSVVPKVRVRWYSNGTLVRTDTVNAPTPYLDENQFPAWYWILAVPGSLIQPGLSVLADVDPGNLIAEYTKSDNRFPIDGNPWRLDVRTIGPAQITLVPVATHDGRVGQVNAGNEEQYFRFAQKIHPIAQHTITVHAVYTDNDWNFLYADDQNAEWEAILEQMDALRLVEHAAPFQHYYGVVDPAYSSGVEGIAYLGGRVAVGWDQPDLDVVFAHEMGHNWGEQHAPCGNPDDPDPNYPYPFGVIGTLGFDVATGTPHPPTEYDIMSYCAPVWTSDYTYENILNYRQQIPDIVGSVSQGGASQTSLLVWGHIRGNEMVLEPAFEISAAPQMPEGHGPYRIEGLDASGSPLVSMAFEGHKIEDARHPARAFAFTIPLSRLDPARLSALRLTGPGGSALLSAGRLAEAMRVGAAAPNAKLSAARGAPGGTRVSWDGATYPMALIRDARTGQVLSFARGGNAQVSDLGGELEVVLSDGVRSVSQKISPR